MKTTHYDSLQNTMADFMEIHIIFYIKLYNEGRSKIEMNLLVAAPIHFYM